MSILVFQGAIEQGFIFGLVALGLYISFRTLNIADLSTDGTFTLGAACSAVFTVLGYPLWGLLVAFLSGALAGFITALLQTKLGVQPILAGIITMTGLYSINLMVMGGKANLNMLKEDNIFTFVQNIFGEYSKLILLLLIVLVIGVLLILFFKTQLGLSIRATGDNKSMVTASSINPCFTTTVGLCLANAIVALSGGLLAQYQKFSDSSLGTGMVVIGLASLIIGEVIVGRGGIIKGDIAAIIGAIIYRIIIAFALTANINAQYLKLFSAIIVAAAISYPTIVKKIKFYKMRRREDEHVQVS